MQEPVTPEKGGDNTEYRKWEMPTVGSAKQNGHLQANGRLTAEQLEKIQTQAYQEGYESGKAVLEEKSQSLQKIIQSLQMPLECLNEEVQAALAMIVKKSCEKIIRHEMQSVELIKNAIKEACDNFPQSSDLMTIYVNEPDLKKIEEVVTDLPNNIEIKVDANAKAGDFRIESKRAQVCFDIDKILEDFLGKAFLAK